MIDRRWLGMFAPLLAAAAGSTALVAAQNAVGQVIATGPRPAAAESGDQTDPPVTDSPPPLERTGPGFESLLRTGAEDRDAAIEEFVAAMTLAEKIGQMCQVAPEIPAATNQEPTLTPALRASIRTGEVGSIINPPDKAYVDEAQQIARDESPHGIPLLIGRDVVHGYRTVFPIPLGQAASWNPELVERAAAVAAVEARSQGINWTFAPMVDVCRDPRWGRIAETLGEDPLLASALAAAMVRGFQQEREGLLHGVVACVKHFAAYGLAEGGRDYNRASLSNVDLHNIYLPPFHAAIEAGCRTLMTTFSEVNGVPGTAHEYLLRDVLRDAWRFRGFVVSDWNSVIEMVEHGYGADAADAARQAVGAGVDMEMVSPTFDEHLAGLVEEGGVSEAAIDDAVRRILRVKLDLAPAPETSLSHSMQMRPRSLELARKLARESLVLLKNDGGALPLDKDALTRIAVVGPLADAPKSQLGCWALDGDPEDSVTPLEAIREAVGESAEVVYARGAAADFSRDKSGIAEAKRLAEDANVAIVFVGEDALLSGEARSRAKLGLPGVQRELVQAVAAVGKPTIMVVLAGRPLTIGAQCAAVDAVLYAWHPGTMGGPAIADVLFGAAAPSGKLPVTFPKSVGQAPLYYGHTNTGRPSPHSYEPLDRSQAKDLPLGFQYRSHYLDSDPFPLFPFGYGLSYTTFGYEELQLSADAISEGQTLGVTARLTNTGERAGSEIVQLYVRDLVSSVVRPVKELKAFRRVYLRPGESRIVEFALDANELAYLNAEGKPALEPGTFAVGVGGDSSIELDGQFELKPAGSTPEQTLEAVARRPRRGDVRRNGK
jgi:beta-glucosidase